ncbi:hypothetical protein BV97_03791 [Novosphingobium resinovorum]|uniref:Uncharacterized protein n=1 Tax=Novosphingobium resinovorum TaxID=158500 RepID=A0A031JSJ1_9SPHN|nr:hypothetical protein BES08_20430 [Novosphingobium resinovorum]EZP79768.1 hypothetical protein BV97_03791 [Novosphingobium resinovorum]
MTERFGAARQDQIAAVVGYIAIGGIHRPHPRPAVDLDGEGARLRAAAKAQGRDTGRIGLVGDDIDAAEDHLIDGLGRERLAQQ